jgi:hypothetical protein
MVRSASGILGTVEVGNGFPRDGTDGEWKIAGRDAILTMKDGVMKLATAEGDDTLPGTNVSALYFTAVRDALDHWQRGAAAPIGVHDCARAVRARGLTISMVRGDSRDAQVRGCQFQSGCEGKIYSRTYFDGVEKVRLRFLATPCNTANAGLYTGRRSRRR